MSNFCAFSFHCWISIGLILIVTHRTVVDGKATSLPGSSSSSSLDYDDFETVSSELYDLGTEKSQARYDPRILSKELLGTIQHQNGDHSIDDEESKGDANNENDSDDEQPEDETSGGAHCVNAHHRYEHGEKIQRRDPCEICLCVDGEVLCWWKKCGEMKAKKHSKKRKHFGSHHKFNGRQSAKHHRVHKHFGAKHADVFKLKPEQELSTQQQINQNYQSQSTIQSVQRKPQNLKWSMTMKPMATMNSEQPEQHMPVHVMNMKLNEMDADDTLTPINAPLTSSTSTATTAFAHIPENVLNSNVPVLDSGNQPMVLNDKVTSISVIEQNENGQKLFIGSSRIDGNISFTSKNVNASKPVILVSDGSARDESTSATNEDNDEESTEKGYFEKTVVNKNGVFIENIRKIPFTEQQQQQRELTTADNSYDATIAVQQKTDEPNVSTSDNDDNSDRNDGHGNTPKSILDNLNGKINRKSIEMMNNVPVAHAQHYVITSSGKIEQTNTLASDDIVAQFQSGLSNNNNGEMNANKGSDEHQALAPQSKATIESAHSAFASDATISSATSTIFSQPNFSRQRNLPGGSFLTTVNSAVPALVTTSTLSDTTNSNCIVLGKSYKIGAVLPQETGNCLQCICVKGANEGDPPRVTCSPHNCPPLILPDFFDSTGY